jgi:hypothetical protein
VGGLPPPRTLFSSSSFLLCCLAPLLLFQPGRDRGVASKPR